MTEKIRFGWITGLLIGSLVFLGIQGCDIGNPSGTLQVFYSGNLTGNLDPCG